MSSEDIGALRQSREAKRKQAAHQTKQIASELEKLHQKLEEGIESKAEESKAKVAEILQGDRRKSTILPPPLIRETSSPSYEALYFSSGEMSPSPSFGSNLAMNFAGLNRSTSSLGNPESDEDEEKKNGEKMIRLSEKKAEEKIQSLRQKEKERTGLFDTLLEDEKRRSDASRAKRDQAVSKMMSQHQAEIATMTEAEKKLGAERERRKQKWQKEEEEGEAKWKEATSTQRQATKEALLLQAKREEEEELSRIRREEKETDLMESELNKEAARLLKEASLLAKVDQVNPPEAEPVSGTRPEPPLENLRTPHHDPKYRSTFAEEPVLSASDPTIHSTVTPNKDTVAKRPARSLSLTNARVPDPVELNLPPKEKPSAPAAATSSTPETVPPTTNAANSSAIPFSPAASSTQSRATYAAKTTTASAPNPSLSDKSRQQSLPTLVSTAPTPTATAANANANANASQTSRVGNRNQVAHLYSPGASLASTKAAATNATPAATVAAATVTAATAATTTAAAEPTSRTARRMQREAAAADAKQQTSSTTATKTPAASTPQQPSTSTAAPAKSTAPTTTNPAITAGRRKSFSDFPRGKDAPSQLEEVAAEPTGQAQGGREVSLALQRYEEDPEQYQARVKMLQEDIGVAKPGKIDPNLWTSMANEGYSETPNVAKAEAKAETKSDMSKSKSASNENLTQVPDGKRKSFAVSVKGDTCNICQKIAYPMEKIEADKKIFHKTCFRCVHCKIILQLGNYASSNGEFYCKAHFLQLFALKGNYEEGFGKKQTRGRRSNPAALE